MIVVFCIIVYYVLRSRGKSVRGVGVAKQELDVLKGPCQVGPGKGPKWQYSTDMGLDWMCIHVLARLKSLSMQNLFSFSFFLVITPHHF
jgi:hypothetical protein